jgi:small-conductance mechanosensitive channel
MASLRTPIRALALLILVALCWGGAVLAQDAAAALRAKLNAARSQLDTIEATLGRSALDDGGLVRLRNAIDQPRGDLVVLQGEVGGPRDASKARLDKLGKPPQAGEPPESAEVSAARKREQDLFGDLDGMAREAQVQVVRADQLANTITERRREAFAQKLTERTSSIIDPFFWIGVFSDLPRIGWSLSILARDAWGYFTSHLGPAPLGLAVPILAAGILAARFLRRRILHIRERLAAGERGSRRFRGALDIVLGIVYAIVGWPMAALIPVLALQTADLLPEPVLERFGYGIVGALLIAVIYQATGDGILAVDRPALRLLPLGDWAVQRIRRRTRWIAVVLGLYALAQTVGKATYAPISLTVASTALCSLLFALISTSLLVRLRDREATGPDGEARPEGEVNKLDILRPLLWIAVIAVIVCLLTGYVALASFFAFFPLIVVFMATIAYVLMTLIDTFLTETLTGDGRRSRAVAGAIGVSSQNIAVAATFLSGILRFVVIAAALMIVTGPLGFYSADMLSAIQRAYFGFQIGEITISPSSILTGAVLFAVVLGVTRLVRAWIHATLLPRTTLDAGLQNSIATIVGYVGVVLAIAVALSEIGLDLQNFAIVAGALSVGIGFGLQSIVSNFVSGLILLAERPIRVGDIIAVSGEEGFVRRISVRATEIETYDRATLIIPNSALISGTVKNWVYANSWARVRVALSIGYDSDIDAVRQAMLSSADDDPRILPSPPPRVFIAKLGDAAIEVELVAVVASVETLSAVRSDLHLRILKAFRAKGLRVAAQLPAAPPPVVVSLAEALGSLEAGRQTGDSAPKA